MPTVPDDQQPPPKGGHPNPNNSVLFKKTTAYQLFMKAVREDIHRKFGGAQTATDWINERSNTVGPGSKKCSQQKVIMMAIGKMWSSATDEEKKRFQDASEKLREGEHQVPNGTDSANTQPLADIESIASSETGEADTLIVRSKPSGGGKARKKSTDIATLAGRERESQDKSEIAQPSSKKQAAKEKSPHPPSLTKKATSQTAGKGMVNAESKDPPSAKNVLNVKASSATKSLSSKPAAKPKTPASMAKSKPSTVTPCLSSAQIPSDGKLAITSSGYTQDAKSKAPSKGSRGTTKHKEVTDIPKAAEKAANAGRSTRRTSVAEPDGDSEEEEEMEIEDTAPKEEEEEEEEINHPVIGASAAEMASIDLELGVEKEWIQVEWEVQKVGKNAEDWMQWFDASVDLRKPVEFDEDGRPRWTISYSRCGTLKATKSVVVFLTKGKLLDDFDGVPLNWRKKSDEFEDVVDLSRSRRNSMKSSASGVSSSGADGEGGWKEKFLGKPSRRRS